MPESAQPPSSTDKSRNKDVIRRRLTRFTMLPEAAVRAFQVAESPSCTARQFASTIGQDIRLTADVLAMANSTLYSGGVSVSSLEYAVVRVGLNQCQNMIFSACARSLMRKLSVRQKKVFEQLWCHGFTTGTLCRHLNRTLNLGFQGEEFTSGLIHDIGRSLLAATIPDLFAVADPLTFEEDENTLAREQAAIGVDHCEIGAWFASHSGLPVPIVEVIQHHHAPDFTPENHKLVAIVAVADHMANHIESKGPLEPYDATQNPFLSSLGVSPQDLSESGEHIMQRAFEHASRVVMPL